ncbi:hypothetical protein ACFP4H_22450 [Pseudophaeobacter arcticus]|uniref:hypothetical protein n=1 Tax=Pseudophaeobacter arcticus TaxID=385492 RepID=UPI00360D771B
MAIIGALRGLLSLESTAFESGAKRGIAAMGNVERRMVRLGNTVERQGRRLALGLTVPMVGAAAIAVKSSLKIVDAQAKMAQSLGTTVASMQVLERAADLSGVSLGEVEQATLQLTKRLSQAAAGSGPAVKALDRLHLSAEALQRLPLDERLAKIQDAMAQFVPAAERGAVASDLFGSRAGLIFTRIDSSALRLATEDVTRFGVAVSEVDAAQIERTNDALSRMGLVGRGLANQLTVALAPILEDLSDKAASVAEWFANLSDGSKALIAKGAALTATLGPLALGFGLVLKLAIPMGAAVAGLVTSLALAPVQFLAAAKASVALELALGATSTRAALSSLAIKGLTRGLGLLRLAVLATGIGALIGVAAGIYQGFTQSAQAAEDYALAIEGAAAAHDLLERATDQFYSNMTAKNAEAMRRAAEAARDATRQALEAAKAELEAASFTTNFFGASLYETDRMAKARADIDALSGALAEAEARLDAAAVAAEQTAKHADDAADNIDAAARATDPLIQGLGGAAGQAAALRGYLSGLPGALAGAQANIAGLKAGMAVLAGGGGEAAANVAKYRAELVAALPPLEDMHDGQRRNVEEGINQQVRLFEENQRLSGEYRAQISALNKVRSAGGAASKSALAALQKEIRDRRALVGLTDEQRKKLEAVRAVQQKLGKEGAGIGKAQIEALADQVIELDRVDAALDRVRDQQERWAENITRTAFEGGSLGDTIKGMLKDIAYQFANSRIVLPVVASVSGILGLGGLNLGGGGGVGAALGGGGGGLGGGGLGGLLNGAGGLLNLTGAGGALSGVGSGFLGVLSGGGLGSSFANIGGLLSGATGGWGAIGAALPALGIIVGVIALLAKGLSRKYAGTGIRGSFDAEGFNGGQFDFYKGGFLRSNRTYYKPLEAEFEAMLDDSMAGLTTGLTDMAETLGLSTDALEGFTGEGFTIWINGKTQEEIQQALQEQIEATGNAMAELILGTEDFSRAGENALETLSRLSGSLLAFNDVADLLGHQSFDMSLTGGDNASTLVDLFGGAEGLNAAANSYFAGFYSEGEQTETILRRLRERFDDIGVAMPESRDGFRELVESLDLTTEHGRKLYASLLQMSGAMDQVLPQVDSFTLSMTGMLDEIGGEIGLQIETARDMAADARAAATLWARTAESLRDYLSGLGTSELGGASREQAAAAQRRRFEEAYEAARGGDQEAAAGLSGLARDYLQSVQGTARSSLEYRRLAALVQGKLNFIAGVSELESGNEEVLEALYKQQIEVLTDLGTFLQLKGLTSDQVGELSDGVQALHADWDGTVEAFQSSLSALENAITDAEAFSYDDLVGRLDVAVALDDTAPFWLRHLVESAGTGIQTTLDFVIRRDDLTAADRWIATNALSEHVATLDLMLGQDLDAATRRLALVTDAEIRRDMRLKLVQDLDGDTRALLLTQAATLSRQVNVALTEEGNAAIGRLTALQDLIGSTGGNLTFDGGVTLTADSVFSDLVAATGGLTAPLSALQSMLSALRDAVQEDVDHRKGQLKLVGLQTEGVEIAGLQKSQSEGTLATFEALRRQYGISLVGQDQSVGLGPNGYLTSSFDYYGGTAANLEAFKAALQEQLGSASYGEVMRRVNRSTTEKKSRLANLREQIRDLGGVPQFAAGGVHAGGWRVVGERGWELENTGSSRVISHSDSRAMLDNRRVVESVNNLARQAGVQGQKVELLIKTIARVVENWNDAGLPPEMV